jgi:hypothetical protein
VWLSGAHVSYQKFEGKSDRLLDAGLEMTILETFVAKVFRKMRIYAKPSLKKEGEWRVARVSSATMAVVQIISPPL